MKILYAKYNRERLPEFQIETTIYQSNGEKNVKKRATTVQAGKHIKKIYENYLLLQTEYQSIHIATASMQNNEVIFEYIQGQSFDQYLAKALVQRDKKEFLNIIQRYAILLNNIGKTTLVGIKQPFGLNIELDVMKCLNVANIDLTFDNIFIDEKGCYSIIDYEWVFEMMPINFILYRSIYIMHHKYCDYFTGFIGLSEIYDFLEMSQEQIEIFKTLEDGFQQYVHGSDQLYMTAVNYLKESDSLADIYRESKRLPEVLAWGNSLDEILKDKEEKNNELLAWGNSLDETIKNKDQRISELAIWGNSLDETLQKCQATYTYKLQCKYDKLRDHIMSTSFMKILLLSNKNNLHKAFNKMRKGEISSLFKKAYQRVSFEVADHHTINDDQQDEQLYAHEQEALVSIVIPVYNNSQYLEKCITSALSQTYINVEVIVVDDCSTDERVYSILDSFATNTRFRWTKNATNSGISATMNNGIIASQGQWIAFLDCDDWLDVEAVEKLMGRIYAKSGSVYGYTDRVNAYEATDVMEIESFKCRPTENYFSELLIGMYTSHLKIIHKDVFSRIGLHESRFDGAQDYDIALKTAYHFGDSAFCYLPEPMYYHRIHNKQTTNESAEKIENIVDAIKNEARQRLNIQQGNVDKLVSFVIISFDKKDMTLQCVQAIGATVKVPYEIIIFDNASSPDTVEFIKEYVEILDKVQVFYSDKNLGCAGGRRQAIKMAKGDYIINLDNDIIVTPNWLEELIVRADSDAQIAAVCCKTIFPDGSIQFNGAQFAIKDGFISFSLINSGERDTNVATALWHDCDWVPGGATLFKGDIVAQLEYSTGYVNAFEDNDISLQIAAMGHKMVNCPSAKVYHHHVMFNQKQADTEQKYIQARYNTSGFIKSLVTFYQRNNLIIADQYVHELMDMDQLSHAEVKSKVQKLAEDQLHADKG